VRRSFAGLFFGAAFVCACLALSGFLLNRTVFTPANTRDAAAAVMADDTIRDEIVAEIAAKTTAQLGRDPTDTLRQVTSVKAGAELFAGALADAHAYLIGDSEAPAIITPAQLVTIVRDERAASLQPVVLDDLRKVTALAVGKDIVGWLVPLSLIGIVVFLVLCFLAHPERAALVRTLGLGLIVLAALVALFGYVVPKFLPTALSDSVWARIPSQLADDGAVGIVIAALVLAGAGLALFASSAKMGRSRRWSTPISTYRYREERRWS
jgi:hypothetical protein